MTGTDGWIEEEFDLRLPEFLRPWFIEEVICVKPSPETREAPAAESGGVPEAAPAGGK